MFVNSVAEFIAVAIAVVLAITVHEFAHAWVADQMGDPTPRREGRVTLNPRAHLDPLGTLLFFIAGFGWGKPVNSNPRYLPGGVRGLALVAAAGPLSNIVLAILFALPLRLGVVDLATQGGRLIPSLGLIYWNVILLNVVLAVFNLIPLAPLDGSKVLAFFIPPAWMLQYQRIQEMGPLLLLVLIFLPRFIGLDILGMLISPPIRLILTLLLG
ncbi:hypothetical protein ARMA_0164 [Ardenticatena maritima]|uniref:Peptidase M50 domain-containing protein n=1 Tax=Ardenticatena maritima TaxID=872965 RepID=A0A0M8K6E6_9CHLR|nr:site-2 protease family protein [Ardenticatena maritima]KPL87971.1 hypothetical protein SE16_10655 [Ardenticatena maritima]GAP61741.1 hypothetical protein ARMA_0164 [Ardenticatena maritima]